MQTVTSGNNLALSAIALLLVAATGLSTARFQAGGPGSPLEPIAGADQLVQVLQGQHTVLWTSLAGPVMTVVTRGWPTVDSGNELGGGLVVERPTDQMAGIVDFGERPMSVEFELSG